MADKEVRLIDANKLERRLIEGDGHDDDRFTEGYNFAINEVRGYIADMPTIEDQPVKHGRWEKIGEEVGALGITYAEIRCTRCGWTHSLIIPKNFCPNCGCYMKDGDSDA